MPIPDSHAEFVGRSGSLATAALAFLEREQGTP
jgi:hypothetical protein